MKLTLIGLITGLCLSCAFANDQFFTYDTINAQSGFTSNPVGFWSDANGTYAANLEATGRSRWVRVDNGAAGNLKTAENPPQLSPAWVLGANASGECCGCFKNQALAYGPCKWSAGGLGGNISADAVTPLDSGRKYGEALMINNQGWAVGYFAAAQGTDVSQDPFVATGPDGVQLNLPSDFVDGRAVCINGKTNTPSVYRIGGWGRLEGGATHAVLWKMSGSSWAPETINDPDNVLANRITWIADINDNGVCVGRIEPTVTVQSGEILDATETGGVFLYDPNDKVRRVNLFGLTAATPVRINNNNEIIVNRNDGVAPSVSLVIPPKDSVVRGCNVSILNLVEPYATAPTYVYDFKDSRRWTGTYDSGGQHYGHVSKVATNVVAPTITDLIVTGLTPIGGTDASLWSLDGDYREYQFSGSGEHSIEVRVQDDGAMSAYQFYGIVRGTTSGTYHVLTQLWRWQFGGEWNLQSNHDFGLDSLTSVLNTNNTFDFVHNWGGGNREYRAKMTFTPPAFPSATPTIQIERVAFGKVQ